MHIVHNKINKKSYRVHLTKYGARNNCSITDIANLISVNPKRLYECFKLDVWPKAIESKIMELFVDEIAKKSNSIQTSDYN